MNQEEYIQQVENAYQTLDEQQLESRLQELAELAQKEYGEKSRVYVSLLSELGGYYRGINHLKASEACFQKAGNIFEEVFGTTDPDYATLLNNLGGTYRMMGDYDRAEELFLSSQHLYEKTLGTDHILYASTLNNRSLVCLDRGDLSQAADLLEEADKVLALHEECMSERTSALTNLASLLLRLDRAGEAREKLLEALDLFDGAVDKRTPHYYAALNALGIAYYQEGRYEEARDQFALAYEAAKSYYGEDHPEVQAIQNHLQAAKQALNELSEEES